MAGLRVLVTGAGGFIGLNLCLYLSGNGYKVTGLDRHYPPSETWANMHGLSMKTGDFRDSDSLSPLLRDADIIVHLASAHLQISLDHREYWDINVHSLEPLLQHALEAGVRRFIHISSVGAYGRLGKLAADEDTACHPQSIYGQTKLAGEKVVRDFSQRTAFPVVILRPAWVYGAFCPRTLKLYKTLKKRRFVMIGDGSNLRHPVYIADFCRAIELSIEKEEPVGGMFLVAGPQVVTTRQLVDTFASTLDLPKPWLRMPYWMGSGMALLSEAGFGLISKEPPVSRRSLEFFNTDNAFDISRARRSLSFEPSYDLSAGLRHCRPWLEQHAA
jgi:nucleoside-diphosphate-sugar epimerase